MAIFDKLLSSLFPSMFADPRDALVDVMKRDRDALVDVLKKSSHKNDEQIAAIRKTAIELVAAKDGIREKDWDTVLVQGDILPSSGGGQQTPDYPFKVTVAQTGEHVYSASIQEGRWTRNPELGNAALTLYTCVRTISDGNLFLCVVIGRHADALTKDPRLYPNAISVVAVNSPEKDTIIGFTDLFTTGGWKYGGHVVLGVLRNDENGLQSYGFTWEQYWKGGDITDALEVNDGDSASTTSPRVRTLERHPQDFPYPTGAHAYENQIMNADAATVDNYNVPYLPKDSGGSGDLTWARLDTHKVSTTSKSIEVASGDLQVKGWAAAAGTTQATGDLILAQRVVSGARDAVYLSADSLIDNYPWKVTVTELSPNNYQRSTQKGSWTRNAESDNTLLTLTTPDVGIVNDGNYVFAFIGRADLDKDPRLFPTVVGTNHSNNTTKSTVAGILAALTPPVYYGGHVVLGKLTAGVWEQYWKGGDITDYLEVLDSDTVNHVPSDERHTIERNPLTVEREGELQLFDADTAVGDKNVPLLSVVDLLATPVVRELEWPAIDHHGNAGISTLEVANPGSGKVLSIMNANGVSADGKHMGYLSKISVIKEFQFAAIDTHEPSPTGQSIEVEVGGRMQIHDWQMTPTAFVEGTHDALLGRIITTNEAVLLTPDSLPYLPDDTVIPTVPPTDEPWPTNPDDLSHHALIDLEANDDHGGVSAAAAGAYVQLIGAAARNAMSGEIGDGSGVQSIDPTARTLDGESTAGEVGWKVTSEANVAFNAWTKGALIVAGGVTVKKSVKTDAVVTRLLDASQEIFCSGTADVGAPKTAIETSGGIKAGKTIQAGLEGYKCGSSAGISKNVSWEDVNGQVHTLEITGGIITAHTVA